MLRLPPNCVWRDNAVPPNAADARIRTYGCTFCADCVETVLHNVWPNCGGGFTPRPSRPVTERRPCACLAKRPASTQRVHMKYTRAEQGAFSAGVRAIDPLDC